jgi:hypothetical protein
MAKTSRKFFSEKTTTLSDSTFQATVLHELPPPARHLTDGNGGKKKQLAY